MEDLQEKFDVVLSQLDKINENNTRVYERLKQLEVKVGQGEQKASAVDPHASVKNSVSVNREGDENPNGEGTDGASSMNRDLTNIQREFGVIKDALQRVKLPNDLKLEDSKQGIARNDKPKSYVISKCAQYAETSVKLLSTMLAGEPNEGDIQDLLTVQIAQMRYLQEEHALLLVNGNFGDGVGRIYRNLRKNTSQFPPEAIDALQAAVTLNTQQESTRGSYRGRGSYQGYRGRGYRGRSYGYLQSGSRVPQYRQDNNQSNYNQSSYNATNFQDS